MSDIRIREVAAVLLAVNVDIALCHHRGRYRPTVVAILENAEGELLFLKSVKGDYWGFPQGGIDPDEHIIDALVREVRQEAGIAIAEVRKLCCISQVEIPGRQRDFTEGRRYYYFHVLCAGSPVITPQLEEVERGEWVLSAEAVKRIASMGEDCAAKRQSMLTALRKMGHK